MYLQQVFVNIIKLSLWGCPIDNSQLLASLSEEDWKSLYEVAQLQGLAAIFIDGLDKIKPQPPGSRRFLEDLGPVTIVESEVRWLSQLEIAKKVSDVYQKNGISTLLLKGLGLSLCYPNPKLRECNDIDIYLFGQYEEGNRLVEQELGASVEKFDLKEDHFVIDGFSFDNHICFRWPGNDTDREFDQYLKDLLKQNELSRFPDSNILLPPPEFNLLFLLSHSYGHFMREGMSLRQMTDIACFMNRYWAEINRDKVGSILQKYQLKRFAHAIFSFINCYFGLSFGYQESVDDKLLKRMYSYIFDNNHAVVYHQSKLAKRVYLAKTAWKNRWCYDAFYEGGFKQFVKDWFLRKCTRMVKTRSHG